VIQYRTSHRFNYCLLSASILGMLVCGCAEEPAETTIDVSEATGPLLETPDAMDTREVDLGSYDVTISQQDTNSTLMVDFQVFAELPNYKREAFQKLLETHRNRVRHAIILKLRAFDRPRLNEPDLVSVREAIKEVVIANIEEPAIENIGFYHFRFLEE
jgi:hypothetical protein